jgi:hypothetical protein
MAGTRRLNGSGRGNQSTSQHETAERWKALAADPSAVFSEAARRQPTVTAGLVTTGERVDLFLLI